MTVIQGVTTCMLIGMTCGAALFPELQKEFSQHVMQECSLVLSPIMVQPGSQFSEQFLWSNQSWGFPVVSSVLVATEIRFTYGKIIYPSRLSCKRTIQNVPE